MDIYVSRHTGKVPVMVFELHGDLGSEEPLESRAQEVFDQGARYILLDLRNVPFVSSSGMRAIHQIYMMLRDADPVDSAQAPRGIARGTYKSPHLKLLSPSKNALKALTVAGYDMFLEIHHSVNDAIDSFG